MSAGYNKQLKQLINDFVVDGEILEQPLGRTIKKELSKERVEFIRLFIDLLLNTNYISDETKIYLSDRYITLEGVKLKLEERGMESNINTIKSKVWYDKNKIIADFGGDLLLNVIGYSDTDITSYMIKLGDLLIKYNNVNLLKNISLDLRIEDTELNTQLDERDFQEFLTIIAPYSKKHRTFLSENIPKNMVGYAMYLLSNNLLKGDDLERKKMLLEILNC